VQWTGVAEILGGLGMMAGCLPLEALRHSGLTMTSAFALFFLTIAVTPARASRAPRPRRRAKRFRGRLLTSPSKPSRTITTRKPPS